MQIFFSQITFLPKSKGERFNAVVGFKDENGTVLASLKKQFREEEQATAFVSKTYTLKTATVPHPDRPKEEEITEYTVVEAPKKETK